LSILDPFNPSDGGRTFTLPDTIIGPQTPAPGGNPLASLGLGIAKTSGDLPEIRSGINPLVTAANHLLNLIPQIRSLRDSANPGMLRDYLVEQIQAFEQFARSSGATPETVIGARYCLCTALDETAAQTPWGGSGVWGKHSLLVTFHNETWGGEKFFQLLAKLAQNPQQHRELLELMYACLALGFEGRYRIVDNGRTQLEALRQRLADILKATRGEHARALSPHWQGLPGELRNRWGLIPVWVVATATALVCLAIYLVFSFKLASLSDDLFAAINNLRMPRLTVVAKPAPAPRLAKFLEPEVKEGLVVVRDEADRSVITLRGDGLFESASATVRDRYVPVITRITAALASVDGPILVTGYTDNVPIRTARFPSNYQLSDARAQSVKDLLIAKLSTRKITAEGRAETDPIAANDSSENRAKNRRVEITLLLSPDEISRQLGAKK
jgi:type VI secretion system protein ImpK